MERVTVKQAMQVFEILLRQMGRHYARSYSDVGGLRLDNNPVYGGIVIEEIINEGGGVSHPFGDRRLPPREFVQAVHFARNALRLVQGN